MKVLNKHHFKNTTLPLSAVYVGRPSKWGNPYTIGKDGSREEVLEKYQKWIKDFWTEDEIREIRLELKGKDLVCWCAPKACHADILLRIANE